MTGLHWVPRNQRVYVLETHSGGTPGDAYMHPEFLTLFAVLPVIRTPSPSFKVALRHKRRGSIHIGDHVTKESVYSVAKGTQQLHQSMTSFCSIQSLVNEQTNERTSTAPKASSNGMESRWMGHRLVAACKQSLLPGNILQCHCSSRVLPSSSRKHISWLCATCCDR